MAGTPEGARKALETKRKKYGEDWAKKLSSMGGQASNTGGFASEKVGKDGLSGKERASIAGKKGGANSPANFKNDPEKAKRAAKKRQEGTNENSED